MTEQLNNIPLIIYNEGDYWYVARTSTKEEKEKYDYPKFVPVNGTRFSTQQKALKEMVRLLNKPGYTQYMPSEFEIAEGKILPIKDIKGVNNIN